MKLLSPKPNDNTNFILNCEKIITNSIRLWQPSEIYINRVDNWFDKKWLGFSGKLLGEVSVWKSNLTIPPFHPNRIESSDSFVKSGEQYVKKENPHALHIYQKSNENLKRYVSGLTTNGLLIWYSGNSKLNGLGSVMCYLVLETKCHPFYLTLSEKNQWHISQNHGISKKTIALVLDN